MATANYYFLKTGRIPGERVSSGEVQTIPMVAGDYGSYDTVTQQFSLYPNGADYGLKIYTPFSLIANLTGTNMMVGTGALTGMTLPTPH